MAGLINGEKQDLTATGGQSIAPVHVLMQPNGPFVASDSGEGDASLAPFFHSLRRQWIVGTVLGVIVAVPLTYAAWTLLKPKYASTAYLRLAPPVQLVFETADQSRGNDFKTFKNTQRQLMVSPFVLNAALSSKEVQKLPQITALTDPIKWLESNLKVTFPEEAEIMKVELVDTEPGVLKPVLKSVIAAYERDVVDAEKDKRTRRLNNLEKIYSDTESQVRSKRESLRGLADTLGTSDSVSLSVAQQSTMQQLGLLRNELTKIRFELMTADSEAQLINEVNNRRQGAQAAGEVEQPSVLSATSEHVATSDVQLAELARSKSRLERLVEETRKRMNADVAIKRIEEYGKEIQALDGKMESRMQQLRAGGKVVVASGSTDVVTSANYKVAILRKQEEQLRKDLATVEEETKKFGRSSIEVEMMRTELASMDSIVQQLWSEIERSKVELQSPSRITVLSEPSDAISVDSKKRIASTAFAGSVGLALPLLLLTLLDRRRRLVDTPREVTSNVRVRLLGTIPEVPTRVMRRLNNQSRTSTLWRWRLTESINSVAAMVQRNASTEDRRVLLISSANAGEGKSTLATYLAMSLAESGHRTILIDFDLRRPSVHSSFEVPLSPGVTDLLYGKASMIDAVLRTEIENLDLLAAGKWRGNILSGSRTGAIKELLATARQDYDFVIVDSCPVLAAADACLVGQHTDGVLLSVRKDVSQLPHITAACEALRSHGVDILGTVVAGCTSETYGRSDYLELIPT